MVVLLIIIVLALVLEWVGVIALVILETVSIMEVYIFIHCLLLDGSPARVGFDAGDGVNLLNAPNSCTDAIVGIGQTTNVGITGQLVYRVDLNTNNNPDTTRVNCVPTTSE